ncbi:hypothetical protein AB0M46_10830 [Dactylosporangium sp. NPDC051485]|uniref:hypothetical protein n=1 Tax=Dactylosporangium sp. NPDC051485 TaxID=3154846 RepID=UPI00342FB46D
MPLDELRTALSQAVELDEPAIGTGPSAVFARADRVRTRQRLTMLVSGVAVLGVAIGAAALAVDRSGGASTTAQAPVVVSSAPTGPGPSPSPSPGGRRADVPGDVVLATLQRLLPAGVATSEPFSSPGFAEVILTDPAGRGKVQVNVQPHFAEPPSRRPVGDAPMDLFSCAKRGMPAGTRCTESTLPDGTLVVLTDGPSEDAGHNRIKLRMADVYRPDHVRIVIGTWNAVHEKTNTATRAEPPLTVQQLQAIATDPAWPV